MQAEDSWPFFFFFFFDNNRNFFPKLFPVVRFEPGTFHSASERLNHSAIPETVYIGCIYRFFEEINL